MQNKLRSITLPILKLIGILAGLIAFYYLAMLLAFMLPSERVNNHYTQASAIIESEGNYPNVLFYDGGSMLDNYTDNVMLSTTLKYDEMNLSFNVLYNRGYARYWHGYVVFLRPLLMLTDYITIRHILSLIHLSLLGMSLIAIHKRFGYRASIPFGVTWFAFYSLIATASLQYFSSYTMMYIGVLLVCRFYQKQTSWKFLGTLFLIIGSVINFLDLLTFPLITLTVPLAFVILIDITEKKKSLTNMLMHISVSSITWFIAYAVTWVAKWVLCAVVLKSEVIADALNQAQYRMVGDENFALDRISVLVSNLETALVLEYFIYSIIPWIVVAVLITIQRRWKQAIGFIPMLAIAAMPYVWYEVLVNHSQLHFFFTYRAQMGTLLVILLFFFYQIFPIHWKEIQKAKRKS